jgi:hypothetical protein
LLVECGNKVQCIENIFGTLQMQVPANCVEKHPNCHPNFSIPGFNFFRDRNQSSMATRPHIAEIKSPLTDECSTRDATNLILPLRVALYPGFRPPNRPKLKDMQDAALYPFYDRNNCPISSPPQREHPQTAKELRPNKTLKLQHA